MKQRCEQLYASLLKDLKGGKVKSECLEKQIEDSFNICNHYCSIVLQEAANYIFETQTDEIYFFKHLKPLFTAEVEYYGFCYHGQLFKNEVSDPVKVKQFWIRESARLEKFIAENRSFYEYYKEGRTEKDGGFFTRDSVNDASNANPVTEVVSAYDPLVSTLLALERYHEYVQEELKAGSN